MKANLLSTLLFFILTTSYIEVNGQNSTSPELKKIATQLIECFSIIKLQNSIILSGECTKVITNRVFDQALALQIKFNNNKSVLKQKLGAKNLKELETQIKNYQQIAEAMNSVVTKEQRASITMWISVSNKIVEDIFIRLNK